MLRLQEDLQATLKQGGDVHQVNDEEWTVCAEGRVKWENRLADEFADSEFKNSQIN